MRATLAVAAVLLTATAAEPPALETLGRLEHDAIREASGLARSRKVRGVFWVVNDSGNPARLFAVRRDGSLVRDLSVNAPNLDWEDLAPGGDGCFYIGDIGNNGLRLPLRAIYRVDEPDPERASGDPVPVTATSYYRFPPGDRFDAEGLFIDGAQAVVVAKYNDGREAELFAVPLDPPAPLTNPAVPRRLGRLAGCTEPVTGACLSDDGRRLAVCSSAVVRVFGRAKAGAATWAPVAAVPFEDRGQGIEAICWDGEDLILAGESRGLFRVAEETWKKASRR